MWGDMAVAFLLAFITAYVCTPYTIRFAKKLEHLIFQKNLEKFIKNLCQDLVA